MTLFARLILYSGSALTAAVVGFVLCMAIGGWALRQNDAGDEE